MLEQELTDVYAKASHGFIPFLAVAEALADGNTVASGGQGEQSAPVFDGGAIVIVGLAGARSRMRSSSMTCSVRAASFWQQLLPN